MAPTTRRRSDGAEGTTNQRRETPVEDNRQDAPLASVANLAPVLGLDEEKVRRMLGASSKRGGWVTSVVRGHNRAAGSTAGS